MEKANAGAHAAGRDPDLQRFYRRKLVQKGLGKARGQLASPTCRLTNAGMPSFLVPRQKGKYLWLIRLVM